MAEWTTTAEELTVVFPVEKKYWDSLNKTEQQKLVRDTTYEAASTRGEVSKLKGYRIAVEVTPEDPDDIVIHSEVWVIPNAEERKRLDGA